ncbi:MAG: LA2681 family HEPN domain-containing protein [Myxococcota bacterium]
MTKGRADPRTRGDIDELSRQLTRLLDSDPTEAIRQARKIDLSSSDRLNAMSVRAAILVDAGAMTHKQEAVEEGLQLFRALYGEVPKTSEAYNLANALASAVGTPPRGPDWLEHQENTREQRAEARQLYWRVAHDEPAGRELRTQAWTNVANQFSNSYRLGEAHDARLAALDVDPSNGVAAGSAARELIWIFNQGGCSDLTRVEAIMLAKVAERHQDRVRKYAGQRAADELAALAAQLGDARPRSPHPDPFVRWVERERLTLSPVVELVDPALGKLDWLMLPGILEREPGQDPAIPPPLFAMFNVLKADFILARDLVWRTISEAGWPTTGRFADTLDYATYGPDASALVVAHRTALDILDKVAVTANHYFDLGQAANRVHFGRMWRESRGKKADPKPLTPAVANTIRAGVMALYGLAELADDYDSDSGILRSQKNLRNAGTHRFVVLHDIGDPGSARQTAEVERHQRDDFSDEVLKALRVARSAIQMLTLSIAQRERLLAKDAEGMIGKIHVPDHDWVRGRDDNG